MKNDDISVLDLTVQSYNALKRMGINTVAELETRTADVMKMLPKTYPSIFKAVEEYRNAADNTTEPSEKKQELIPTPPEEAPAVFDYSELDNDTADKLRAVSEKVISIKTRYILETAQQVKIAHDLLANNRDGMFGAWCVSVGFTRQTGNNYLNIVKLFDNITDEQRENLTKLTDGNIKLLYDTARPSAPPELVEQVMSGDITTHKDYIALKKQLDEARKQSEKETAKLAAEAAKTEELKAEKERLEARLKEASDRSDDKKIAELEAQIKELENRPVEVVYEKDETEINRLQEENTQLEKQLHEAQDELMFAAPQLDDIKIFAVKLTLDEYEALMDITDKYGDAAIGQAVKNAQIIRI